jgi:glycosyltransferase involved in cell wall biosynthesis
MAAAAVHAAREGAVASSGALLALLAHGVPTVAARTPYDDDVFTGTLQYAEAAAEPVAAALSALIDSPSAAVALSTAATARYRAQFAWSNVADGVLRALNKEHGNARLVTA